MKRFNVEMARVATDEAHDAAAYIAQDAPERAEKWYSGLLEAIRSLDTFPERCSRAREAVHFPGRNLRQLIYKSHRVIFEVEGRRVKVLHVRHAAMRTLGEKKTDLL